jgi:hypothetical protein
MVHRFPAIFDVFDRATLKKRYRRGILHKYCDSEEPFGLGQPKNAKRN